MPTYGCHRGDLPYTYIGKRAGIPTAGWSAPCTPFVHTPTLPVVVPLAARRSASGLPPLKTLTTFFSVSMLSRPPQAAKQKFQFLSPDWKLAGWAAVSYPIYWRQAGWLRGYGFQHSHSYCIICGSGRAWTLIVITEARHCMNAGM